MESMIFEQLKVIELCRVYSGPLCGMMFGDLGAEVIKVERPDVGDESRKFGNQDESGRSCYYNSLNRNKKSISLNLKDEKDKNILINLIKEADVFVHNWLPGSMEKIGFSYDEVHKMNSRIIYCSISGYGYNSPYRNRPSQDIIAQSLSGFLSLTKEKGRVPLKTGIPVIDHVTGTTAAFAIMSALYMREKTGKGQLVHTSLLENAISMTSFEGSKFLHTGIEPEPNGNRHPAICPYNVYQCIDGHVTIAVANDNMWQRFCVALDIERLIDHDHYRTNVLRLKHQDRLEVILEDIISTYQVVELVEKLNEAGISSSRVNTLKTAQSEPSVQVLDMYKEISNEINNEVKVVGKAFHLEDVNKVYLSEPPKLQK